MGDVSIRIHFDRLPGLPERLNKRVAVAVRKAAFEIEAEAKSRVPVDTGALKNSIYTVTDQGSTYGQAAGAAVSANPRSKEVPEMAKPPGVSAIVAVAIDYGIYVEMGTRKMEPQPFLGPAAEIVEPALLAALRSIVEQG